MLEAVAKSIRNLLKDLQGHKGHAMVYALSGA